MLNAAPDSELVLSVNPDGTVQLPDEIVLSSYEVELLNLVANHPEQKRTRLIVSPTLCMSARMKAEDMNNREYYDHDDPDGHFIFDYVKEQTGGSEIIAGRPTMSEAVEAFYESSVHKKLMLDFVDHIYVGAGVSTTRVLLNGHGVPVDGRVEENNHVVLHFSDTNPDAWRTRQAKLPDGTPLGGVDVMGAETREGLQMVTPWENNKWNSSWFGRFVDVGGGFILHDSLGMIYHDIASADTTHSLDVVTQTGLWYAPWKVVYDDSTRGVSNQGFNFYHSYYGWLWTHPDVFPYVWKRNTQSWLRVNSERQFVEYLGLWKDVYTDVTDVQTGETRSWNRESAESPFIEMSFANWQVYVGDPAVLAWNSGKSTVQIKANVDGEIHESTAGLHAWGWTAANWGEYTATMTNQAGESISRLLVVIPQPTTADLWIDAEPKTVKAGEPFMVAWSGLGDVPPQISGTSYGVFTNLPIGSQLLSRSIPGKYTFTIRMGNHKKTVTVQVVE